MNFLDHIEQAFKYIFKSINLLIGICVGTLFGALLSLLLIMYWKDGFSFTDGWYWFLLPGGILGALIGIRLWPLILGFFLGTDSSVAEYEADVQAEQANELDVDTSDEEKSELKNMKKW
jgi:hypothetical protein